MSLRLKLVLWLLVPLLAVLLVVLSSDYSRNRRAVLAAANEIITERATAVAAQIDGRLRSIMRAAEMPLTNPPRAGELPILTDALLRQGLLTALRADPAIFSAAIYIESQPAARDASGRETPARPHSAFLARRTKRGVQLLPLLGQTAAAAAAASPALPSQLDETRAPWLAPRRTRASGWTARFTDPAIAPGALYAFAVPLVDRPDLIDAAGVVAPNAEIKGVFAVIVRGDDVQSLISSPASPRPPASPSPPSATSPPSAGATPARDRAPGANRRQPAATPSNQPAQPATPPEPIQLLDPGVDAEPTPAIKIAQSVVGPDGFVVIDRDWMVVTHSSSKFTEPQSIFKLAESKGNRPIVALAPRVFSGESGVVEVPGLDELLPGTTEDSAHILAFAPIPAAGWTFTTALPQTDVLRPVAEWLRTTALMLALGLLAVIIVVILVSIRLTRPVEQLARAVDRLGSGDLSTQIEGIKGRDELARLAGGFNTMVAKLRDQVERIRTETTAREQIEGELQAARKIQENLLPSTFPPFPDRREFELHASNAAARHVAGDFYDFFFVGRRLLIVIADVSGKGVPAAMLMAVTRTLIRNFAAENLSVGQIARRVNEALRRDSEPGLFVTCFIGTFDVATGHVEFVSAGHPPPMILSPSTGAPASPPSGEAPRPTQRIRQLADSTAPMLGVFDENEVGGIGVETIVLKPGCTLVLFTDGVTEAADAQGRMLGHERLAERLATTAGCDAKAICSAVVDLARNWQAGTLTDDLTVLVLRRLV